MKTRVYAAVVSTAAVCLPAAGTETNYIAKYNCGQQDAVTCFVAAADSARSKCESEVFIFELEADTARMRGTLPPLERQIQLGECAREAQIKLRPYLDQAKAVANPELAPVLMDYYVETIAYLKSATAARADESTSARKRRTEPQLQSLTKLNTRIDALR